MDYFDHGVISPLASLRERPSDESSFVSSVDDTFSFVRRQPRRKVLTVAPQVTTSAYRGHSQMYPYARVASDRHEVGIGSAEMTC